MDQFILQEPWQVLVCDRHHCAELVDVAELSMTVQTIACRASCSHITYQALSLTRSLIRANNPCTEWPRRYLSTTGGFPTPHLPLADALHSHVSAEELALKLDEEGVLSGDMATLAAVSSLGLYTPCEDEEHNGEARTPESGYHYEYMITDNHQLPLVSTT